MRLPARAPRLSGRAPPLRVPPLPRLRRFWCRRYKASGAFVPASSFRLFSGSAVSVAPVCGRGSPCRGGRHRRTPRPCRRRYRAARRTRAQRCPAPAAGRTDVAAPGCGVFCTRRRARRPPVGGAVSDSEVLAATRSGLRVRSGRVMRAWRVGLIAGVLRGQVRWVCLRLGAEADTVGEVRPGHESRYRLGHAACTVHSV